MNVKRTAAWVEREYGTEKWPAVERLIAAQIEAEPDITLSRALQRVARQFEWEARPPFEMVESVIDDQPVRLPLSASFGIARALIVDVLHHYTRPDTRLVCELGAGWGWHLLTFWFSGGPRDAEYVAAEYTEAGRRAATTLAALDPQLRFRAEAFDYHHPVVPSVDSGHALVYTSHSLEQIPHVDPALIDRMAAAAPQVTAIHVEPVGWQTDGYAKSGSSRANAERHDYNRDLVAVLRDAERAGTIRILEQHVDVFGVMADNASTIIVWTAVR